MKLKDFIENQMWQHSVYVQSFKKAPSNSNEHIHPATGRTITYMEMDAFIQKDAEKRANSIIRKLEKIQSGKQSII